MDRQTDRRTDGRTDRVIPIYPKTLLGGGVINIRDPNKFGAWDKKIGFFIGNAGKSRGQSPRYLCHMIKFPDDQLREWLQLYRYGTYDVKDGLVTSRKPIYSVLISKQVLTVKVQLLREHF